MSPKRALIVVFALLGLASAGAAGASTTTPPRAQLRNFSCRRALDPPTRAVTVTAVMRPIAGTQKMQIRFQLLRRLSHHRRFAYVHAGDLGKWISPKDLTLGQRPSDVWNLIKQVADLAAPAWYRFRVAFRWLDTRGQRLDDASLESRTCYQPELRPDLVVRSITVRPVTGRATENAYTALIENVGASGAGSFQAELTDAAAVQTTTIRRLAPHTSVWVRFVGAVCTQANAPTVTVDPGRRVDDANRGNNSLTATCPGS